MRTDGVRSADERTLGRGLTGQLFPALALGES
jgi:hypothetical protein